ncbi:hypothetical protein EUGRSUZ_K02524 [Eucalyptus grandis]|uniref:Uncharacterized protein n=2 Tax=Eucalyptus grandis TaxID=71139 RepID=A0ACC3IXB8_EUCGR|nr:hypothetical protein EUGRSUZ_K02524 [Eucalyptus grandis]
MIRRYWNINLEEMVEARVHFGHGARKWNPRIAPYISAKHKIAQAAIRAQCHYAKLKVARWYVNELVHNKNETRDLRTEQKAERLIRLPKRAAAMLKRQSSHLQTCLSGINYITGLLDIVIIVDQQEEYTVLLECITLGIILSEVP